MIEFRNVSKYYKNDWLALNRINLKFDKGQFYYLIGKSGAGKSTLLKMIYMEIFPSEGEIIVENFSSKTIKQNEIPLLRKRIGVIFQDFKLLKDRNVYDNVAFALQVTGEKYQNIRKKTLEALSLVKISHKRNSFPYQLSGGEQQKVAIARALVKEPFILIADEPTGNVDPEGTREIMDILFDINTKGTAILMATHDYSLIKKSIGKIIGLREGKIVNPEDIFKLDFSGGSKE